jgi:hypothetical protein
MKNKLLILLTVMILTLTSCQINSNKNKNFIGFEINIPLENSLNIIYINEFDIGLTGYNFEDIVYGFSLSNGFYIHNLRTS